MSVEDQFRVPVSAVAMVIEAANTLVKPWHPEAIAECADIVSEEVARGGEWFQHATEGVINSKGQNVKERMLELKSTRPHWELPEAIVDGGIETWTVVDPKTGKLRPEKQVGRFHVYLDQFAGNVKMAERALEDEAALFGCKPGDTTPGVKPGAEKKAGPTSDHKKNPWHKSNWNISAQGSLIKAIGFDKAAAIAKSVGCVIGSTKPNPNY